MNPFAVLGAALFVGLISSDWLRRHWISLPMLFVAAGFILGNDVLGWLDLTPTAELTKEIIGITMGLLLFSEASTLRLQDVMAEVNLESRLIVICVAGSIGIGALLIWLLFPNEEIGLALLIGAALAPTDAALSLPFNTNRAIPERLRNALHVESGLSDGLVAPVVALFIPLALVESAKVDQHWFMDEVREIIFAVVIGIVAGVVGGSLIREARHRGWTSTEMAQLAFMTLAITTFFSSGNWDGNRYIAVFVGGLITGTILREDAHEIALFTEGAAATMSFAVWMLFGAVLVPLAFGRLFDWRAVGFAILALTLLRSVPVVIALVGIPIRRDTLALFGWFGPRGLPSVAFLVTALVFFLEKGASTDVLVATMTWTILLSVLLHGLSARPLSIWYARRLSADDPSASMDLHAPGH